MIFHRCALALAVAAVLALPAAAQDIAERTEPVKLIYDTDIGNDVDDALALGVIHALADRGECELLAVTITKDEPHSAAFIDAVNTWYGRPDIPIGVVRDGATKGESKFTPLADAKDGDELRYPHDLMSGEEAPDATEVLRKVLAQQPDNSVVIAQVGFSTNLARLLESEPDEHSPFNGCELAAQKVKVVSAMAGAFEPFQNRPHPEYNVVMDIPSAQKLAEDWPTPIVYSGFEIGVTAMIPAESIEQDYGYAEPHILHEAYRHYNPDKGFRDQPTWDLTSVLWAVRPERGYFSLSQPVRVEYDDEGYTHFTPIDDSMRRYLIMDEIQTARVREALSLLASQPPRCGFK